MCNTRYADGTQQMRVPDAVGNLFTTEKRQDRRYGPAGQLLADSDTLYAYDTLGNLIRKSTPTGEEWRYSWNGAGQLAEIVRPDGSVVRFAYDALGRRISKVFAGQVTQWVWDGDQPLHEWTSLEAYSGTPAEVVTWLFEEESAAPVAKLQGQHCYGVVTDHLGTPLELYAADGRPAWQADLDSYGRVRQTMADAQTECPFRYQGQYEDQETGLYYNRFRYYDPNTGTYISQDPIRLKGGDALYAYVHDTTAWVDEFGLACQKAVESLPKLRGKSVPKVQKVLKKQGFVHRNPANPKNERWVHSDGSEVQIHKYGNTNTTPYKSGNNAHLHKSIGKHGDPSSIELNDKGVPSIIAHETHIGIKNPADYPMISGRPHGT